MIECDGATGGLGTTHARFITFDTPAVAAQHVNLLGVDSTLTATGSIHWNLDVDPVTHMILSDSSLTALFQGTLPSAFGPLTGAPFNSSADQLISRESQFAALADALAEFRRANAPIQHNGQGTLSRS